MSVQEPKDLDHKEVGRLLDGHHFESQIIGKLADLMLPFVRVKNAPLRIGAAEEPLGHFPDSRRIPSYCQHAIDPQISERKFSSGDGCLSEDGKLFGNVVLMVLKCSCALF